MWVVYKQDSLKIRPSKVIEQLCKTKKEAESVAKYESKWRGVYGYKFTVEELFFDYEGLAK
jgi:hypothetical protein